MPLILWLSLGSIALELRWARYDYLDYREDVAARTRHLDKELEQWRNKALGIKSEVAENDTTRIDGNHVEKPVIVTVSKPQSMDPTIAKPTASSTSSKLSFHSWR